MTQALNDSLAAMIRAAPNQWFWMHRRWKPHRVAARLAREAAGTDATPGSARKG